MSINIAVVIGVSQYSDSKNNLPGCKNDAEAIHTILIETKKFDKILYLNENYTSAQVKEQLTNFIITSRQETINEFFFYYSGHGEFTNSEFYYMLSDFDNKKRNQTSLQNNEIDNLIRSTSPVLVIKLIDACQSGTTYIKDVNVIDKYFTETKNSFNKCYFLNSSLNNQSSYQDDNISFFTKSIINSIKNHSSSEIRYKDIIDVLVDDFTDIPEQTPFFVVQAELTEKFCTISESLRDYLFSLDQENTDADKEKKNLSIIDLVILNAKDYVNKEGALLAIDTFKNEIIKFNLGETLDKLYKIEVNFLSEYESIPRKKSIETWLKANKGEYFTTTTHETVYDEDGDEFEMVSGFDLKIDLPFKAVTLRITGNYPNLKNYNTTILFILSKRMMRLFYFITNYKEEGWDSETLNISDIKWLTSEFKMLDSDDISRSISKIRINIQNRIEDDLKERLGITDNTSNNDNEKPRENDNSGQ